MCPGSGEASQAWWIAGRQFQRSQEECWYQALFNMAAQSTEGSRSLGLLGEPHGAEGWVRPLEGPSTPGIRLTWSQFGLQGRC